MLLAFLPGFLLFMTQLCYFFYVGLFAMLSHLGLARPVQGINKAKKLIEALTVDDGRVKMA